MLIFFFHAVEVELPKCALRNFFSAMFPVIYDVSTEMIPNLLYFQYYPMLICLVNIHMD